MSVTDYYKKCLNDYENFSIEQINAADIEAWFKGQYTPFWVRSKKYYELNITKQAPLDDEHLRKYILPLLPTTNRQSFLIKEIYDNLHNTDWWYINIRDLIYTIDHMYVKKAIKERLQKYRHMPIGMYHSWLTRLYQILNTYIIECALAEKLGLNLDIVNHSTIHTGFATKEEAMPDFTLVNGQTAELKVCSKYYYDIYLADLKANFEKVKKADFHNAIGALFFIKEDEPKLYKLNLNSVDNTPEEITKNYNLTDINYFKVDDNNIFKKEDLPAVPKSLLFGLIPEWLKIEEN